MPTVQVDGVDIAYQEAGEGPVLLMVHGLFFDHRMWAEQVQALSEAHRCLVVDAPCHGGSGCPKDHDLWRAAELVVGLLDELGIDQVHWMGLSMGGMIGLRAALAHPERLASLILVDTTAESEPREALHTAMAKVAGIGRPMVKLLLPYAAKKMFSPSFRSSGKADPWLDKLKELDPKRLRRAALAVFQRASLTHRLEEIDLPTLILVGDQDEATPPDHAEGLKEGIPGARRALIPGAGHMSPVERPEYVNRLVQGFLDEQAEGPPER